MLQTDLGLWHNAVHDRSDLIEEACRWHTRVLNQCRRDHLDLQVEFVREGGSGREGRKRRRGAGWRRGERCRRVGADEAALLRECGIVGHSHGDREQDGAREHDTQAKGKTTAVRPPALSLLFVLLDRCTLRPASHFCGWLLHDARRKPELKLVPIVVIVVAS